MSLSRVLSFSRATWKLWNSGTAFSVNQISMKHSQIKGLCVDSIKRALFMKSSIIADFSII